MTEPTTQVPVTGPTTAVPVLGPDPFTRGWQGPALPGHPGSAVATLPAPYVGGAPSPFRPVRETSTPAVIAFVFGCLSMTGVAPLSIVGLILNWTSWQETRSGRKDGHPLQVAGLVMNLIGVGIGLLLLVGLVLYMVFVVGMFAAFAGATYS